MFNDMFISIMNKNILMILFKIKIIVGSTGKTVLTVIRKSPSPLSPMVILFINWPWLQCSISNNLNRSVVILCDLCDWAEALQGHCTVQITSWDENEHEQYKPHVIITRNSSLLGHGTYWFKWFLTGQPIQKWTTFYKLPKSVQTFPNLSKP